MVEPKEGQSRRTIHWDEIMHTADIISSKIKSENYNSIYGVPRGGLVVAVVLSHKLDLPIVSSIGINKKTLVVDDISDSGETLQDCDYGWKSKFKDSEMTSAVLFQRKTTGYGADFIGELIDDEWLVFPWEVK